MSYVSFLNRFIIKWWKIYFIDYPPPPDCSCIVMLFLLIIVIKFFCFWKWKYMNFVRSFIIKTIIAFLVIICTFKVYFFFFINVGNQLLQLRQLKLNKMEKQRTYLRLIKNFLSVLNIKFRSLFLTNSCHQTKTFKTQIPLI